MASISAQTSDGQLLFWSMKYPYGTHVAPMPEFAHVWLRQTLALTALLDGSTGPVYIYKYIFVVVCKGRQTEMRK